VLRIRWSYWHLGLVLFVVGVVVFTLHLHSRTLDDANQLTDLTIRLDEQSRWLQLAQQRILRLSSPVNDLFGAKRPEDYRVLHRRLRQEKGIVKDRRKAGDRLPGV